MKILFCGDFHADWDNVHRMLSHHLDGSIDLVVQVGDFGFWTNRLAGLYGIEALLDERDVALVFADGNHENHEALAELEEGKVSNNIYWMPRGSILELEDAPKIAFFGGASSLDKSWRTPGYDWFPGEIPTEEDLEILAAAVTLQGLPDVMVTHEVPIIAGPRYDQGHHGAMFPKVDRDIADNLRKGIMMKAYDIVQADLWFYGHHHQRMTEFNIGTWGTDFYGLGMNMQPDDNWVHAHDF